ncbi:MAG: DUF1365 domain-containing protein [Burkholderiaceae bacterium]
MNAAGALIGFGRVWHRRVRPVHNAFSYASYFLLLPMRALRARPDASLKRNRFGALSFFDRDHGDGRADSLAWLDELLVAEGIADATGEVWLHTFPRVLGHVFNPVSFWYAHRGDGTLAAVLAEVNNTFGERHIYLLCGPQLAWDTPVEARKVFHVSPFCAVQGQYRFRFILSRDSAAAPRYTLARIDHEDAAGPLLQTRVGGSLQPLTAASARRAFFGMPLMTLCVVARIHWQALRLALKRVPFHRQPPAPERFITR